MKTKNLLLAAYLLVQTGLLQAQNTFPASGSVGIGTASPYSSSLLEVRSTSKGFLIPRMTQAQRTAIASPETSLLIYQTDQVQGFYYYASNGSWLLLNNVRGLNNNIFIGQTAGEKRTTAKGNIAIGKAALKKNTTRSFLVAVGDSALWNNGTGVSSSFEANYNTAIGSMALKNNSIGAWNTAVGYKTLYSNTIGNSNTAVGSEALQTNSYGEGNTAIGHHTLQYNNGFSNVAVGKNALNANTSGSDNVALGREALFSNTDRSGCVAIGSGALYNNGIGVAFFYEASDNVAVGHEALNANTTGFDNTAVGAHALYANNTGFNNTAIGSYSISQNSTGFYNTAIGDGTLSGNTTGERNTAIGHSSLVSLVTGTHNTGLGSNTNMDVAITNSTVIGNNAYLNTSNSFALGNSSIVSIKGQVGFTTFSDARIKNNVAENVPGLSFINALRPVTYQYDIHKQNEMMGVKDNGDWTGKYDIENMRFTGFIAQEVEAAARKAEYDFSGIDKTADLLGLRYAEFTVPLVKAVQELDKNGRKLEEENAMLKSRLEAMEQVVAEMKSCMETVCAQSPGNKLSEPLKRSFLNITPNPSTGKTMITYSIEKPVTSALIKITDDKGVLVRSISANTSGSGSVEIDLSSQSNGKYIVQLCSQAEVLMSASLIINK